MDWKIARTSGKILARPVKEEYQAYIQTDITIVTY